MEKNKKNKQETNQTKEQPEKINTIPPTIHENLLAYSLNHHAQLWSRLAKR